MARFDYFQLERDIQTKLQADAGLAGVTILVEENVSFFENDHVIIHLKRREVPDEMQSFSAGTRMRMLLRLELVCVSFAFELAVARENRDDLVGKVELALMGDRQFSNSLQVNSSWIEGGEFEDGTTGEKQLYSLATIDLVVDVVAINT